MLVPARKRQAERDDAASERLTRSLAGLAATLLWLVLALAVVRQLQAAALSEDCVLAGYVHCDQRVAGLHAVELAAEW